MKAIACLIGAMAALSASFYLGMQVERMETDFRQAHVSGYCYSKGKFEAFVARDGVDYACFKQHIETKKIIKTMIVTDGHTK